MASELMGWIQTEDGAPPCEVGDRFLVLVQVQDRRWNRVYWEPHVVVATEGGWDDANGDSWSAWDWSDVSYYIKLCKSNLPPLDWEPSHA